MGSVHGFKYMWNANFTIENWGFFFVYTKNAFNLIIQVGMLWTVCHLWPSGACSVLNCYCHHYSLVWRNGDKTANILQSREGMMQGTHWLWLPMGLEYFLWSKSWNWHILMSHLPGVQKILGHWVRLITWREMLIHWNAPVRLRGIISIPLKAFW